LLSFYRTYEELKLLFCNECDTRTYNVFIVPMRN